MNINTGTREQAIELLGNNVSPESTAAALGVSVARISQLLSEDSVARAVAERRLANVQSGLDMDKKANSLEEKLLAKLEKSLPLMVRPELQLKAYQTINNAKRRSANAAPVTNNINQVVNLTLPAKITANFVVNNNNQVVQAGNQTLVPMQSANLRKMLPDKPDELTAEDL